jgi:Putative peptidoglycan binding domain
MLKLNDKGIEVMAAKSMLYAIMKVDAEMNDVFSLPFQTLVRKFQRENGLTADGIIGTKTFAEIRHEFTELTFLPKETLQRVQLDVYTDASLQKSFPSCRLRTDAAQALEKVKSELQSYGCLVTTSGTLRDLGAIVTANRSSTSLHYVGLAIDLYLGAAMLNTTLDPYVVQRVVKNKRTSYVVWARCNHRNATVPIPHAFVPENIVTYRSRVKPVPCEADHFVNLTEIMNKNGFSNIHARRSFENGGDMTGAEWWHFQFDKQLVKGIDTFGNELLKIYPLQTLQGTAPYLLKDAVWGIDWN